MTSQLAKDWVENYYFFSFQPDNLVNGQNGFTVGLQFIIMVDVGRYIKQVFADLFSVG